MEVPARRVTDYDGLQHAGDYLLSPVADSHRHLMHFVCPCGCGDVTGIQVGPVKQPKVWQWDGNADKPTVTPSILRLDRCKWHGFLADGIFRSC